MFFKPQPTPEQLSRKIDYMALQGIPDGSIFKYVRILRGISRERAAEAINITVDDYDYVEANVHNISDLMRLKLLDLFHVYYDFHETLQMMYNVRNCGY